ncbi:MAG: transporter related [Candidatus Saccharibacteria bacterium]|nr:transporter related [Candidatus Saccharibacteria bacterium]
MNKKVMIQVSGLSQEFETDGETIRPLQQANFSILENTFNIIYGPSGSGKSTMLNILSGLQAPTAGTVMFEGQNIYKMSRDALAHFRAHRLGVVYQTSYWVHSLNVLENVAMPLYFLGYSRRKAAKLAMLALQRVGMERYAKKSPIFLSGGEQQRIGLARALATSPLYVIADEPTGNLDTENGDKVMNLLLNCQTEFRCTIILVTHNMEYVPLADHLIHIQDGLTEELQQATALQATEEIIRDLRQRVAALARMKAKDATRP